MLSTERRPAPTGAGRQTRIKIVSHSDLFYAPPDRGLPAHVETGGPVQPEPRMAAGAGPGAVFATVLPLVVLITNVRVRGVWTLAVLLGALFLSVLSALAGWWDHVLPLAGAADVHINALGYLCISATLFVVWLAVVLFVGRLTYVTFTRGQFRVHLAVGAGETAYEVIGMVLHKRRDDLFRHWVLGFGWGT
jgi:hypothetical protein